MIMMTNICLVKKLPFMTLLFFIKLLIFSSTFAHSLPVEDTGGGIKMVLEDENNTKTIMSLSSPSSSHLNINQSMFEVILSSLPESEEMARRNLITHIILLIAYGLLIVVSLVGNTLVCRVLLGASKRSAGSGYPKLSGTGTSKLLIVNLAASDLLLTTVNIPTNLVRFVARDWTLGEFICTLMPFAQSVSAYCSAWTMMVIAFERYRKIIQQRTFQRMQMKQAAKAAAKAGNGKNAVIISTDQASSEPQSVTSNSGGGRSMEITLTSGTYHPNHHHILLGKLTTTQSLIRRLYSRLCYCLCAPCFCCCPEAIFPSTPPSPTHSSFFGFCGHRRRLPAWAILGAVWAASLALSFPHSQYSRVVVYELAPHLPALTSCKINAFESARARIHLTLYTFSTQYVLPIGITTYCYLHIGLFLWRRETVGALSEGRRLFLLQRKRRRVRMLIAVVLCFAVCWLPLNLYVLARDYNLLEHHQLIFFGVHWLAMSSVVWNPFIYCWLNEAFRAKTKALLRCFLPLICWRLLTGRRPLSNPCGTGTGSLPSIVGVGIGGDGRVLVVKGGGGRRASRRLASNGMLLNNGTGGKDNGLERASVSWSSSTMSATGRQQAISELISMSGLLEQDLLDSSTRYSLGSGNRNAAIGNGACTSSSNLSNGAAANSTNHHHHHLPLQYTKEQRLALTTTQSGRRKIHTSHCQLIMMLKMGSNKETANNKDVEEEEEEEDLDVERDVTKTTDVNLLSSTSPSASSSIEMEQTAMSKVITAEMTTPTEEQENSAV